MKKKLKKKDYVPPSSLLSASLNFGDLSIKEALLQLSKTDPYLWTMTHRRLKSRPLYYTAEQEFPSAPGVPTEAQLLRHRPFLIQPLRDQHPHKVYKKCRQIGISELSITETLAFLDSHPNTKWIYCVPVEAEILTRRGWKRYHDVVPGDETLGLNVETQTVRWEKISCVKTFEFQGALNAVGPFHCTLDHRWPTLTRDQRHKTYVPRVKRTFELSQRDCLVRMAPFEDNGSPSILSPRLAAILGWVVTDGHHCGNMMTVYQSQNKYLEKIEALLRSQRKPVNKALTKGSTLAYGERGGRIVGYTASGYAIYGDQYLVRVRSKDVKAILAAGYKSKADLVSIVTRLSVKAARAMFRAMMLADGCLSGPKKESLFFAKLDPHVRDAFQVLCALLGFAANLNKRGAYVIRPGTRMSRIKPCVNKEPPRLYKGIVWCPQTASGTWYMRYRGKVVHTSNTFPRDTQLKDFSITRIAEALDETPFMRQLVGIPNQVYTKRIGESYLILRSAWESNLGEGIDADGVTLDEKDRMKEGIDIAFRESLQSSKYKLLREVSTPTLPGRGVDARFQESCQYEWFVKCEKCGKPQPIKYPDNIIQLKDIPVGLKQLEPNSYEYLCSRAKCRGKLNRLAGQWVAKYPEKSHIAGYHMPQTIAPWQNATTLMQKKIDYRFLQLWLNYCMAECSTGDKVLVSDDDFFKSIAGHSWQTCRTQAWSRIVAGLDWGHFNWCVIIGVNAYNNLPYLIGFNVVEDNDADALGAARQMHEFLTPFDPDVIVADAGYGKDRNAYLLKRWGERFYACYYNPSDKHSRTFKPQFVDESSKVIADRTIALKTACHMIRERGLGMPAYDQSLQLVITHFRNLAPMQVEDNGDFYEVIDHTGDDHLAHCVGYALMAFEHITHGWGSCNITEW